VSLTIIQSFGSDGIKSRQEWENARSAVNGIFTGIATPNIHASINQARKRIDAAYASVQNGEQYVFTLEKQLGIVDRWEPGSSEFQHYQEEAQLQDYRIALDELERLVVQRLFELSKLGMSGTGRFFFDPHNTFIYSTQDINFARTSVKHYSGDQKLFEMHSPDTMLKLQSSSRLGHPLHGKK
jgi:hypothetical protein